MAFFLSSRLLFDFGIVSYEIEICPLMPDWMNPPKFEGFLQLWGGNLGVFFEGKISV